MACWAWEKPVRCVRCVRCAVGVYRDEAGKKEPLGPVTIPHGQSCHHIKRFSLYTYIQILSAFYTKDNLLSHGSCV